MSYSDAELIKRTLDGDETAFGFLVDKYKGAVHALAYRKVGDFHIAEEITQDTFLKAYQKLRTLKDPKHFSGWLYVIAARCCISFNRKKRLRFQSIESISRNQMDSLAWAKRADARVREEVHDALESLPESDRTVLTLYYLGGLTVEEIARFMGTSRVAIKNRLYRARLRLKKEMIEMIQETLGSFQLPSTLTQRIMERIHHLKPTPTPISKPLTPWIAATTLVVVALFFGLGVMQSARFQLPYSLDNTESAMTVELTEAPILEIPMPKQTIGKGTGSPHTGYLGNGSQANDFALGLASNSQKGEDSEETGWTQTNGPYGGIVLTILATPKGTVYAGTQGAGVLRLSDSGNSWIPVNTGLTVYDGSIGISSLVMMEDTLYAGLGFDIFRLTDDSDTWQWVTRFNNKSVTALAVMGNILYAGTHQYGVLRSTDAGNSWTEVNNGLTDLQIRRLAVMGTTLYAGTEDGAFRLADNGDSWIPINAGLTAPHYDMEEINRARTESGAIPVPIDKLAINRRVDSFAVLGDTLYMGMVNGLFRSVDKGNSWTKIDSESLNRSVSALSASGTTLYAGTFGGGVFRSTDGGDSWITINTGLTNRIIHSLLAVDGTLYVGTSGGGVFRLAGGEDSWLEINNGLTNTTVRNLVFLGNTLYGATDNGIVRTVDEGKSWTTINTGLMISQEFPYVSALVVSGPTLYAATTTGPRGGVFRLEDGGNSWIEVNSKLSRIRSLVVIGTTFYAGTSGDGIFRLETGDDSWTYLGVPNQYIESLAVSGTKLYAGTALGGIFRSVDGGKSWTQVNEGLTNRSIQSLVFVGTTLYAGTFGDGVFRSMDNGDSWAPINAGLTDTTITVLSVSGTTLYAGTHHHGVFRLEEGDDSWAPVGQMHRDVRSLAVSETTIYAGTMDGGVFRISQ